MFTCVHLLNLSSPFPIFLFLACAFLQNRSHQISSAFLTHLNYLFSFFFHQSVKFAVCTIFHATMIQCSTRTFLKIFGTNLSYIKSALNHLIHKKERSKLSTVSILCYILAQGKSFCQNYFILQCNVLKRICYTL